MSIFRTKHFVIIRLFWANRGIFGTRTLVYTTNNILINNALRSICKPFLLMHNTLCMGTAVNNLHFLKGVAHDIYKYKNANLQYQKQNHAGGDIEFEKIYLPL